MRTSTIPCVYVVWLVHFHVTLQHHLVCLHPDTWFSVLCLLISIYHLNDFSECVIVIIVKWFKYHMQNWIMTVNSICTDLNPILCDRPIFGEFGAYSSYLCQSWLCPFPYCILSNPLTAVQILYEDRGLTDISILPSPLLGYNWFRVKVHVLMETKCLLSVLWLSAATKLNPLVQRFQNPSCHTNSQPVNALQIWTFLLWICVFCYSLFESVLMIDI